MSTSEDRGPRSEQEPSSTTPTVEATESSTRIGDRLPRDRPVVLLLGGLLAGVAAWGIGELTLDYFQASPAALGNAYDTRALNRETARANALNGVVAYGSLGALVGLWMGLAGVMARGGRMSAGLAASGAGLVLGAVAASVPAAWTIPWHWFQRVDTVDSDLLTGLLVHGSSWAALGAAAGLVHGVFRGGGRWSESLRGTIGGLVGGLLATLVYEITAGILFPTDRTADPISASSATRFLARVLVAVGVVGMVSLALRDARRGGRAST